MNISQIKITALLIMTVISLQFISPVIPTHANTDTPGSTGISTDPVTPSSVRVFSYLSTKDQAFTPYIGAYIVTFVNFLALLIGSFGILAVIVGGYFLLTAGGREEAITRGKDIIKFAIIGIIVAISAFWMVAAVQSLFY